MIDTIDQDHNDILKIVQTGFPVTERPFLALADRYGMSEQRIIESLKNLIAENIVRTFGPVFEPRKLGYRTTLAAAEVDQDRIAELATFMLNIREITHNYLRGHDINLWFTVTAFNDRIRDDIIRSIGKFPGVARIMNLPMVTVYKIRAVFGVDETSVHTAAQDNGIHEELSETERELIRTLQDSLPVVERPFKVVAEVLHADESNVIARIQRWVEDGTIRRIGARLNHRQAGYTANALTVWQGDSIDAWGGNFAELSFVSHCYRREPHEAWPYELYAMVHARSEGELKKNVALMKTLAPGAQVVLLPTQYELKKTSMKYFLEVTGWDSL